MPPANSGQQLDLDDGYAPSDETVLINALSYFSSALIGTQEKPFSHGLFDMDRGTVAARMVWLKISFMAVVLLIFIILGILSIYWAALGRSFGNIHKLSGYVVDFDGGQIGQALTQAFSAIQGDEELSWLIKDPSEFPNGPSDVQAALLDNRCWAAVTVNPDATSNLMAAINSTDAAYNTTQAISAYLTVARNEAANRIIISPMVISILTNFTQTFGLAFAGQLASHPNLPQLMNTAPSLVTLPVDHAVYDLRPFDVPVASAVDYVGLIYLMILAFILINNLAAANERSGFGGRLTLGSMILIRLLWPITLYCFISLVYCLLSLAFGVPFGRHYGNAGFVIYWMMSWMAMAALGLALEAMFTLLTVKFVPLFLVLWIIANVSVSYYPIEMLPVIFQYGYAMPFYNVAETVRTVVFNTKNQIGLNFGVQFAWIAVSCITLPIFQWLIRRREVQAWRQSQSKGE
ncbi:Protein of unknown function (DUF3533) domain containing protein [Tylopilus felleus]